LRVADRGGIQPSSQSNLSVFNFLLNSFCAQCLPLQSRSQNSPPTKISSSEVRFQCRLLPEQRTILGSVSQNGQHSRECILSAWSRWQIAHSSAAFLGRYHSDCTTCTYQHNSLYFTFHRSILTLLVGFRLPRPLFNCICSFCFWIRCREFSSFPTPLGSLQTNYTFISSKDIR
jgi:hypothetical protein